MTRLLVVARNSKFPALNHSAPASPPRVPSSPRGTLARSQSGNAALHSAAPASVVSAMSPLRAGAAVAPCATGFRVQGAPLFDATACRWIVPPSSMPEDAGAAAELRHLDCTTQTVPTPMTNGPVSSPEDTGHSFQAGMEAFTVLGGVAVFGALALFFLVLA